jgi:hypothetical protein
VKRWVKRFSVLLTLVFRLIRKNNIRIQGKKHISLNIKITDFRMLRMVDKYLATDVSGPPIVPIFKGQEAQDELFLNCLTLDDGPIGFPETSATNYHSTLHNISEERRSHLHRGGSMSSRIFALLGSFSA